MILKHNWSINNLEWLYSGS